MDRRLGTGSLRPPPDEMNAPGTSLFGLSAAAEVEDELSKRIALKCPKDALGYWNKRFEQDNLTSHHFREWWRQIVPKLMSPTPSMDYLSPNSHLDEEQLKAYLFLPLEKFLCGILDDQIHSDGTQQDPDKVFKQLSSVEDPPSQCGRVFRIGEPTYSCRDCGHDATCVLCIDCFKYSEHRLHRYKMSTSCGGGYCDCGDREAWKDHVHCSVHMLGTKTQSSDPLSKLPPGVRARARQVFEAVLGYTYEMLTWETPLTLPSDLISRKDYDSSDVDFSADENDNYATVVFNDETHTFDEVISTLPRAVGCDREVAVVYATFIDREGRCLVKCSGYQACSEVKAFTERITSRRGSRPLKVVIMHCHVVAHQMFALRLLSWLHSILDKSVGFRALFSYVMLEKSEPSSRVSRLENFFRRDTALWKSARSLIHRLFVSGMLMEYDTKRSFAEIFTRCYGNLIKDYIADDHEHSFSVTSLSVQLFTVPTLANHLTANCDVLAILLRTFLSECERKTNSSGKLEFQRTLSLQGFHRASYILHDTKYLLTTPPKEGMEAALGGWSNELRRGFLHGVSILLNIFHLMQGMDLQIRQTTHHVEYELEWEAGFNLHIRLAPLQSSVINWCAADRIVFIKTVRMLFKKLHEDNCKRGGPRQVVVTVGGRATGCVDYAVSSMPISFHLPLTRLLSGLSLHFTRFGLDFDSNEFDIAEKPSPIVMIEPSLRALVVIAQVQARMWLKNGHAVVEQVRVYHDPRCRREMQDSDILMLQWGASLMDPNDFLVNLVHKFQLQLWSERGFDCSEEDSVRQMTTLVEEFFSVLIHIVSERYTPRVGEVTPEDSLRREIVQMLCEAPMSHSALNRALSEDIYRETGMEKAVTTVADFKKPNVSSAGLAVSNQSGKGVYELKQEFYSEFNVFFYHYSKEQQSKAEESQRKRKRASGLPECHPPPLPPQFSHQFRNVLEILRCDVYIYLLSLVLERADNLKSRCFSENQVHRVLHLIGLSLLEEERAKQKKANEVMEGEAAPPPNVFDFTNNSEKFNLYQLLEQLVGSQRIPSHKHLLEWVIKKWKSVAGFDEGEGEPSGQGSHQIKKDPDVEKKRLAAERRQKIMDQMAKAQKSFMAENAKLFVDGTPSNDQKEPEDVGESGGEMDVELVAAEGRSDDVVALGHNQTPPAVAETVFTCILCQEEDVLSGMGNSLVMASFIQKSTVLSNKKLDRELPEAEKSATASASLTRETFPSIRPDILPADLYCCPHVSSCGHAMHSGCYDIFFEKLLNNELTRSRMRQPQSYDVENSEFLCPMCRCLSNSVLPLIPQFHALESRQPPGGTTTNRISFPDWIAALAVATKHTKQLAPCEDETLHYACPLSQVLQELEQHSSDSFHSSIRGRSGDHDGQVKSEKAKFNVDMYKQVLNFSRSVCEVGLGSRLSIEDGRVTMATWQATAFTLHSVVWSSLDSGKKSILNPSEMSVRHTACLSALVKVCGIRGIGEPEVVRSHGLKLLSMLLDSPPGRQSILEVDAVGMLVALTCSFSSLFSDEDLPPLPSGNDRDLKILRLVYLVHVVQILLTTDRFSYKSCPKKDDAENCQILDLLHIVRDAVGFASDEDGRQGLDATSVWSDLKLASLPFLRCAALFYHHVTDVRGPENLQHFRNDEFEVLSRYLSLPTTPADLLQLQSSETISSLVRRWAQHPNLQLMLKPSAKSSVVTYPLKVNSLVPLPYDYSELINSVSHFTCPKNKKDDSRVPAMCLVCGVVLCSQSYCCQVVHEEKQLGACTAHTEICGGGCGIFLRLRESRVVLLANKNKGFFIQSPYVDQYGETDTGLKRGNPLHLCQEKYRKIYKMWLNHSIPKEISNSFEPNPFFPSTPWYHL